MKLFAGLMLNGSDIYMSTINSSGIVILRIKVLYHEGDNLQYIISIIKNLYTAYNLPFVLTINEADHWGLEKINELKKLPIKLCKIEKFPLEKANFYTDSNIPNAEFNPFKQTIHLALIGALSS